MTIRRSDAAFAMNLIFSKRQIQIELLQRRRQPSGRRRGWLADDRQCGCHMGTTGQGLAIPLASLEKLKRQIDASYGLFRIHLQSKPAVESQQSGRYGAS